MAWLATNEQRVQDLVWLIIDPAVVTWQSTLFSNKNAASSDAQIDSDEQTVLKSTDRQREVLVKGSIATSWITFPQDEPFEIPW